MIHIEQENHYLNVIETLSKLLRPEVVEITDPKTSISTLKKELINSYNLSHEEQNNIKNKILEYVTKLKV